MEAEHWMASIKNSHYRTLCFVETCSWLTGILLSEREREREREKERERERESQLESKQYVCV